MRYNDGKGLREWEPAGALARLRPCRLPHPMPQAPPITAPAGQWGRLPSLQHTLSPCSAFGDACRAYPTTTLVGGLPPPVSPPPACYARHVPTLVIRSVSRVPALDIRQSVKSLRAAARTYVYVLPTCALMGARPCRGVPASGTPAPSRVGRGSPAPPPLSPLPTVAPRHGGRGSATLRDSGSRGCAPRVRYASALRAPPPIIFRLTRSTSPPLARSARWRAVGRKRPPFPPPTLARSFRACSALPHCSFDFLSRFQYKNAMIT